MQEFDKLKKNELFATLKKRRDFIVHSGKRSRS